MTDQTTEDPVVDSLAAGLRAPPLAERIRDRWLRACLLFFAPTTLFFVLGVRPLEPMNGQDGYLYTGMVPRIYDFLSRFPDAYYGTRFGYILPTWLATRLFGFEGGYLMLRLGLLGAICVVLGWRLRPSAAALAVVIISTSPIILVASFTTYTLSVGVLALVAAAVVLSTTDPDSPSLLLRATTAGALLAISWNSHLVVLPLCVTIAALFLFDHLRHGHTKRVRSAAALCVALGVGATLVTVIGILIYGTRFGFWDVYGPSLDQARRPTDTAYLEPGWRWVAWRHYLWVGPLAVVSGALAWRCEPDPDHRRTMRRLTSFTAASLTLFGFFQWVEDDPLLATYFYSALPLSLAIATLAFASAAIVNRMTRFAALSAAALALLVPISIVVASKVGGSFAAATGIALVACSLAIALTERAPATTLGVACVLVAASWTTVSSPHDFRATPGGYRSDPYYDGVLLSYDWGSIDRAQLVDEFARALPSLPDDRGAIRVWFDPAVPYDQLSAPLAWRRSALNAPLDPGPPAITDAVRSALIEDRPRYVVIIDGLQVDADQGAAAIISIAPYSIVWERRFTEGPLEAHAILLERAAGTWPDFPCPSESGSPQVCLADGE